MTSSSVEFIVYGDTHAEIRSRADAILDQHGVPATASVSIEAVAVQLTVDGRIVGYGATVVAVWDDA